MFLEKISSLYLVYIQKNIFLVKNININIQSMTDNTPFYSSKLKEKPERTLLNTGSIMSIESLDG